MSLVRTEAPLKDIVDIQAARDILTIETDEKDTEIKELIKEASELIEKEASIAFYTQTFRYKLDKFNDVIKIPRPPLQSISSIQYIDDDGAAQTVLTSVYDVDVDSYPGEVRLAYSQSWPSHRKVDKAITINFVAGYASVADVPKVLKRAVKMQLVQMFDYPDMEKETKVINAAVKRLLANERLINI